MCPRQPKFLYRRGLGTEYMRYTLTKQNSTKPERIFAEVLKEYKIPFKHRWLIGGREIDFVIRNVAIEIDGHEQDGEKNRMLVEKGYIPIHLHNSEVNYKSVKILINQLWDIQTFRTA